MRQPYQVLIIPYMKQENNILFAVFHRKSGFWQFVSGGGEEGETVAATARRELAEETGVQNAKIVELDAACSVPVNAFSQEITSNWHNIFVVPEYAFAVDLGGVDICLSDEHDKVEFCEYDVALKLLKYDSNKTALFELNEKIKRNII